MTKSTEAVIKNYYQQERKRNLKWLQLSIGAATVIILLNNLLAIFLGHKTFEDLLFNLGMIAILAAIIYFFFNLSYKQSNAIFRPNNTVPETNLDVVSWAQARGLDLKPDGLRCDLGLLGGPYREFIFQSSLKECVVQWNELQFITVQPKNPKPRRASPPYYKLILKKPFKEIPKGFFAFLSEPFDAIYIQRTPFYGNEQAILTYIATHAAIPIELNDSLR